MNQTIKDIINRRSVRKFTDEEIDENDLNTIIECGLYAASGSGKQSTKLLVIQDKEIMRKLEILNATSVGRDGESSKSFYGAKMVIVVLADKNSANRQYDGALVMGNMMLAASALGYGSCWINRARESFETEEGKQLLADLHVEGEYEGVGNLILGHVDGEIPQAAERKPGRVIFVK